MQQKKFISNILLLLFLNLLVKSVWMLGVDVGVQNRVGAADYGLYFAVLNFTFLFNMLLDMGITNFNNRNIARHAQLLPKHFPGIITLKIGLGVVYVIVTLAVGVIIGYDLFQLKLLLWIAFNQFLNSFILYLRSNISSLMMFKTDSFLSVLDRLLMVIFCGILLWGNVTKGEFKIEWFIYSQTAAYVIAALIAFIIVVKNAKPQKLYWNLSFFRMILKKSFPFAILYFLMAFYNRIDSVMIERILPHQISSFEAGIYASAFRLLDALAMFSYLFSVILLPLFSKMLKEKENLIPIIKTSFSLLFVFSTTAVILLIYFRYPVLDLLYNDHIRESANVFKFLIPCIIPISFTYIFGTLLTAHGSMKLLNITAVAGIVVNIAVNIILIPRLHAQGAAIASLCTQSIVSILQIFIVFKELKFSFFQLPYWRCLLFLVILILVVHSFSGYFTKPLLGLIMMGAFAVLLAFSVRLFSLSGMKKLFK